MLPAFTPRTHTFVLTLGLGLFAQIVFAQPAEPILPPPVQFSEDDEAVEMLTRGALHEAFADQVNQDLVTGVLAPLAPPESIDELPPEIKPDGDDIEWIPGYWYWDDERNDYIWISGVWRKTPPGRRWVPGYWTEADGKYRRVSGVWSGGAVSSGAVSSGAVSSGAASSGAASSGAASSGAVSSLEYLPYPPDSLELGPVSPAPSDDYFWVPGNWVYYNTGYSWRPGHWELYRNDWVWMPTRYVWSPGGCLYQSGYWDYPFASRGQLYSPVYFHNRIYQQPRFCFQPSLTISTSSIFLHLFVRSGHSHYYFGNYYGNQYHNRYYPWYNFQQVGRRYDPLITFAYGRSHHAGIDYVGRMRDWNRYFTTHADYRPPTTIRQQREFERSHKDFSQINQVALGRSIQQTLHDSDSHSRSHRTSITQQTQLRQHVADVRTLTETRRNHEAHALPKQREGLAATSQQGFEAGRDGRGNGANHNRDRSSVSSSGTAAAAGGANTERSITKRPNTERSNAERSITGRSITERSLSRDDRIERGRINRASTGPASQARPARQGPAGEATRNPAGQGANAVSRGASVNAIGDRSGQSAPASSRASNSSPATRQPQPTGPNLQPRSRGNSPTSPLPSRPVTPTTNPTTPASPRATPAPSGSSLPNRTFEFGNPSAPRNRPQPEASSRPRGSFSQPGNSTPQPRASSSQPRPSFSRAQPQPGARNSSPVGPQRNASPRASGFNGRQPKRDEG